MTPVPSAEDLIAAGQHADAAAMCANEIANCRKAVEAFESQGGSLSPETARAFDARITTALQLIGYAEAGTRDFKQPLSHTAEALSIARQLANEDSRT